MHRSNYWIVLALLVCVFAVLPFAGPVAAQDGDPGTDPQATPGGDVVATVNGEPILRDAYLARVRLVRWQYLQELETLYEVTGGNLMLTPSYVRNRASSLEDPVQLGDAVLYQMEEERLLWQEADARDLLPTGEQVKAQEDAFFSLWTNVPVDQLAGDGEAQTFITDWYAGAMAASGMTAEQLRTLFESEAVRQRLFDQLAVNVPLEEEAVLTRHILCAFRPDNLSDLAPPTEEERVAAANCAETALIRLANGERFEAVAMELSDDLASAQRGGEVGWQLLSYLMEPYAEAAQGAELNTVVGPVETVYGYHVIEVLEREMQELSAEEYENSKQGYFQLWIDTLHEEAAIERSADWDAGLPTSPGLAELDPAIQAAVEDVRAQ